MTNCRSLIVSLMPKVAKAFPSFWARICHLHQAFARRRCAHSRARLPLEAWCCQIDFTQQTAAQGHQMMTSSRGGCPRSPGCPYSSSVRRHDTLTVGTHSGIATVQRCQPDGSVPMHTKLWVLNSESIYFLSAFRIIVKRKKKKIARVDETVIHGSQAHGQICVYI